MKTNGRVSLSALGALCVLGIMMGWSPQAKAESASAGMTLSEADRLAVFKAAGAVQKQGRWVICDGPDAAGGASIESVRDLNGDGRPEAVVSEGGTYCYGGAEAGFKLLSKQADGKWRVMTSNNGMATFLKTRGTGGWPDISVGRPGFCFPVDRWNGKEYKLHRFEYEGKRCKPQR